MNRGTVVLQGWRIQPNIIIDVITRPRWNTTAKIFPWQVLKFFSGVSSCFNKLFFEPFHGWTDGFDFNTIWRQEEWQGSILGILDLDVLALTAWQKSFPDMFTVQLHESVDSEVVNWKESRTIGSGLVPVNCDNCNLWIKKKAYNTEKVYYAITRSVHCKFNCITVNFDRTQNSLCEFISYFQLQINYNSYSWE